MIVKIKSYKNFIKENKTFINDKYITNYEFYVYSIIATDKDKLYLCEYNDNDYLLLNDNYMEVVDDFIPTYWQHEIYDKYKIIENYECKLKLKEFFGPKEFINDQTLLADIFGYEARAISFINKYFNPQFHLQFEIENTYDNFLYKILKDINNENYIWKVNDDEVYKKDSDFLFNKEEYKHKEFMNIIKNNDYYIVHLKLEVYLNDKLLLRMKIVDNIYVDILLYDRELLDKFASKYKDNIVSHNINNIKDVCDKLILEYPTVKITLSNDKKILIEKDNIKITLEDELDGIIELTVDNENVAHSHINYFDNGYNEIYETIKYYIDDYKDIINNNKKFGIKKIIIIIVILLIILTITCIVSLKNNNSPRLEGRWTSTRDSLIRVIKEYKDGYPVYANEDVVEYWLDLKNDGKYILYYNDVVDQSRSNYNIEKNLLEKGKYNLDSNSKIYFDSDNKNLPSNSASYIWTCEVDNENLHNCTNYAYEFVKQ